MLLDTTFHALDLIIKLIPGMKTLTGARRKEYFAGRIQPVFEHLGTVHDGYTELILNFRNDVIALKGDATPTLSITPEPTVEHLQRLKTIKDEFLKNRSRDDSFRISLREDAKFVFETIKWKEERRFMAAVMYYFLDQGPIALDGSHVDRDIERILEKGGVSEWDTPSLRLHLKIRDAVDFDEIIDTADFWRHNLNQQYMNARLMFRKVEQHIIMEM